MTSPRRIGAPDSKNRAVLLDATQQLMLAEGYAAVSSRRVAAKASLKPQLVHYYFRTMDDLFLAVYRRGAEHNLERYARALASKRPLKALWQIATDPAGTAFLIEFVALAKHRKAIRTEIARHAARFRRMQLGTIGGLLEGYGIPAAECPPIVLMLAMTGVSQVLVLEEALGITAGHREMVAFVERYIRALECGTRSRKRGRVPGQLAKRGELRR